MIKKEQVLVLALIFCLAATLFIAASVGYDAWVDLDDDGDIDADDLYLLANEYGTSGEPINKTALLLELQSKIDSLNATVTALEVEINDLQMALINEAAVRQNADNALQNNIDAEEMARIAVTAALQSNIDTLQSQMLPQGFARAPAYDSGWVSINPDMALTFAHNLGTTEVLVYVIGKQLGSTKINQAFYGGAYPTGSVHGLYWFGLDDTSIRVHRTAHDTTWEQVRVMIWKIQ